MTDISVRAAAAQLGIAPETVRTLIADGTQKAHKQTLAINSPFVVDAQSIEHFDALRRGQEPKQVA